MLNVEIFIRRPVATGLLMAALFIAGLMGLKTLPVSALPEVDYPTIQVTTLYPGAGSELAAATITAPLERQLGQMPGLANMRSKTVDGASVITLTFDLAVPLDTAESQTQAAISAAANLLPQDLPYPPTYAKFNPADAPIAVIAVQSPTMDPAQIHDWADTRLAPKIAQIPGVGTVSLAGGGKPALRIKADPGALAAKGLGLEDLRQAIANANSNAAKGSLNGPARASSIEANSQISGAGELASLPLAWKNNAPLRLSEVASVSKGPENDRIGSWRGNSRAAILEVRRQPGSNVVAAVDKIKETLLEIPKDGDLSAELVWDRTVPVKAGLDSVRSEMALAVALVIAVIFVFLRDARATAIAAVAVPLSMAGTFAAMAALHFTVNNLTMMALTISTGFVVDDAIVMIENIERRIAQNPSADPFAQAVLAAREIFFTIVSLTVSLCATLIPLLFMSDVVGRLFREFAATLAISIVVSAAVSLTLTPMMGARMIGRGKSAHAGAPWIGAYQRALDTFLSRPKLSAAAFFCTLACACAGYGLIDKGLFPEQDNGAILAYAEAPPSASFEYLAAQRAELANKLAERSDVRATVSLLGSDGVNPSATTWRMLILLSDRAGRRPAGAIADELSATLGLKAQAIQDLALAGEGKASSSIVSESPDPEACSEYAAMLAAALEKNPALSRVSTDDEGLSDQLYVDIDRDSAARAGLTVAQIDAALYDAYGQRQISTVFTQSNLYRIILEADPQANSGPESLRIGSVPLSAVARVSLRKGRSSVTRQNQFPSSSAFFEPARGTSLGEAAKAARQAAASAGLPASAKTELAGAAAAFEKAQNGMLFLVIAAIVCVYIVLGILYESLAHPLTIISTLPSAGIGALLALAAFGKPLDMVGVIGLVLLIGIVKKNAIMMIDFAIAERRLGATPEAAIRSAAVARYRPILMTTAAALLGAVPLALGHGAGSEMRMPLGASLIGGLLVSQLLTLFSVPSVYLWLERRFPHKPIPGHQSLLPESSCADPGHGAAPAPGAPGERRP